MDDKKNTRDAADGLLATMSGLGLSPAEITVALLLDAADKLGNAWHITELDALAVRAKQLIASVSNRMNYSGLFAKTRRPGVLPRRRRLPEANAANG